MVLRVSEVYASVQGEGPNTGQTTVFVRFGGCNLRCPGWPCDTQHAIDPAYRKDWSRTSASDLAEQVSRTALLAGARLITLTGGEPFLQPHGELEEFVQALDDLGYRCEAFTNGTLSYPDWAVDMVSMIIDWKLPGSGEFMVNDDQRLDNLVRMSQSELPQSIKFVCLDLGDLIVAKELYDAVDWAHDKFHWYYGKVWESEFLTDAALVEHVMITQLPWRLNVQLHNYIWDPQERGR